jgi:hypothetical protein
MYSFGTGILLGTRTDIPNTTPVNFGLVQEVTIEETATIKELHGQFQRAIVEARGTIKTIGKAKVARISGLAFAHLFFGATPVSGQLATAFAEAVSIPVTSPFTANVVNANGFKDDNGVVYLATGLPLIKVASIPEAGEYSVSSGSYSFNEADAGKSVLVSYVYSLSNAGHNFTISNQLLGTTPTFQAQFYTTFQGQAISLKLHNCTSTKLSFKTKLEDFVMPEFDFSCFADAAGNVMTWSFAEVS